MAHWRDACESCLATFGDHKPCEKSCLRAAQWAFGESMRELGRAVADAGKWPLLKSSVELRLYSLADKLERRLRGRIE